MTAPPEARARRGRARLEEDERISARQALRLYGRALRYVGPFRLRFAGKLAITLASLLPPLLLPWPVKIVIDHVIEGIPIGAAPTPLPFFVRPFLEALSGSSPSALLLWMLALQGALLLAIGAFGSSTRENDRADAWLAQGQDTATQTENAANAGFSFVGGLLGLLDFRFTMRLTQALNHHYRSRLFERIQALPMPGFADERVGDAVFRVMYDTPAITNVCYRVLLVPVAAPLGILLSAAVLALLLPDAPWLVAAALAFVPLSFLATLPFAGRIRSRGEGSRRAGATTTASIEEGMANLLAVQSQGQGEREKRRFGRDSEAGFGAYRALLRVGIWTFVAGLVPGAVLAGAVFLAVADGVIAGRLSLGDFTLLFTYFLQIAYYAVELGGLWINVQEDAPGLHRVFFLMDQPAERDRPGARPLRGVLDGVRYDDVDFVFPDGTPGLRGVSFEARVGSVCALVGPAGAGKTTLASLLPRFLAPTRGRVCLDGVDVEELELASLRRQIAFVFQETALFEGTIAENIRLGRPDASDAEVRRAARLAGVDEFAQRLPLGYDTALGRAGGKLSVGQKQRLAIARALVREAPILILDEPTSALDPETEQRLVEALREACRDRLVLVIAHRLSTVRAADQILFLQEGRVLERGSHTELLARPGGAYRRFVELQTRGAAAA